jgi:hypothetical protein
MTEDLGPRPDPQIEPGEPNPGGADAIDADQDAGHQIPDLPTAKNPAVDEDATPDEVQQTEDTATAGTEASGAEGDSPGEDQGEDPA